MARSVRLAIKTLVAAVGTGICSSAGAAYYEEVTATHLPPGLGGACMNAAAGDADGDGDLDLALAMEFEAKVLLINDGLGHFSDASMQLPQAVHDSEDVAFADFDNDDDVDLVFVSEDDRTDEFYLNDGSGRFADASFKLLTNDVTNDLVLMDLDGDGNLDLLTGNIGLERALISDGKGGFRDETGLRWPQLLVDSRTQELEAGDVDGDGDLDIIVANEGQNQLYLNEDGRLVDVTVLTMPVDADETRAIRAVDVDADDDVDLLVGNVAFLDAESPQDYLLLNDGRGVFTRTDPGAFPEDARSNFMLQALDIDRDGDMDAIAPSTVFATNADSLSRTGMERASVGNYQVLLNDGSGRFAVAPPGTVLPVSADGNGFDVEVADFDADGLNDLFFCNRTSRAQARDQAQAGGLQRLLRGIAN